MEPANNKSADIDEYISRFPINKKVPLNLISRITKFRVSENLNKKKK